MSFEYLNKMPSGEEIKELYPLSSKLVEIKKQRDKEIREVFEGKLNKLVLVIGPCSADREDSVCEYVSRLSKVQEEVKDKVILVPRVYTNKPRTNGDGYKGIMHQPDPQREPNMAEGVVALRKMHIRVMEVSGLTAADEMLYPENYAYLDDILSYVAIGARSVENQQHRLTVSGLDIPVGMKNPTGGDLNVMFNSVYAGQHAHTFEYQKWEVKTKGNPLTHAILRGSVDKNGGNHVNYHYEDLLEVTEMYAQKGLLNPAIIVDTNHANSKKKYDQQPRIAMEILNSCNNNSEIKKIVKGLMIESYLVGGTQPVTGDVFGQSITDGCIGWEETRNLIHNIAEKI